jgi:hypothetical protein
MADEVDKYDEKDVSVHFCLYAQDDPEKAERGEKGVPAGTVRVVKSSLKVSFDYRSRSKHEVLMIWYLLVARTTSGVQTLPRVRAWKDPRSGRARLGRGGRT